MAIVKLNKMTLYGSDTHKDEVIGRLQELGCVHLVNLGDGASDIGSCDASSDARDALNYLKGCTEQRRQVRRRQVFDREQVVADTLKIKRHEQDLLEEREELEAAINDLQPWGDFQIPEEGDVGGIRFWFYVVPNREAHLIVESDLPYRQINSDHQNTYFVVLSETQPEDLPGQLAKLDRRSLTTLRRRLEEVEELLEDVRHQRIGATRWSHLLTDALDAADDAAARERALRSTLNGRKVYAVQGWAPQESSEQIRRFAKEHGLAVSFEPPQPDEKPPTLLHNPESLAGSEALVTFYKTPEYRSWDPSIISYISFAIFFAMILADAGYGILLALIAARFWKKMGQTQGGRRGRNVLVTVVVCSIIYGILCGSYFGVSPAVLRPLAIIDAESQALMMPLTIVIGVIHLSLANVMMAWTQRGRATALASLGWVIVMAGATLAGIGGFADLSDHAKERLTHHGLILLVSGLVAVFLFSSDRPLLSFSFKNHALRLLDGVKGLTGISGLFGDVLSYLRLFALGLSSARLSQTFNNLGASAWDEAGFGVIAAIGIVILGHTLNLLLSIMSGVVHGLRLNCIEFYKWSLPEDGYLFEAFARKERQP